MMPVLLGNATPVVVEVLLDVAKTPLRPVVH